MRRSSLITRLQLGTAVSSNMQSYVMGSQICVTVCTFIIARITSVHVDINSNDAENIFGVSDRTQNFFNTGLLGAIMTTVVATLAWLVIASSFPIASLSNPLVYAIIRVCLLVEASGVCSASWLLARGPRLLVGYQLDEVYIGTAHDQLKAKRGDFSVGFSVDPSITMTCEVGTGTPDPGAMIIVDEVPVQHD